MAGTRKLGKFNLGRQSAFESGTRRLEKFDLPALRPPIVTPVAEMAPAVLAAARRTIPPAPTVEIDEPAPLPLSIRTIDREPGVEQLRLRKRSQQ